MFIDKHFHITVYFRISPFWTDRRMVAHQPPVAEVLAEVGCGKGSPLPH